MFSNCLCILKTYLIVFYINLPGMIASTIETSLNILIVSEKISLLVCYFRVNYFKLWFMGS